MRRENNKVLVLKIRKLGRGDGLLGEKLVWVSRITPMLGRRQMNPRGFLPVYPKH